jgi:hypothetical protein
MSSPSWWLLSKDRIARKQNQRIPQMQYFLQLSSRTSENSYSTHLGE